MRELPILFSGAMVRAILAGTKTQTRRVAKGVHIVHEHTGEALARLDSAGPRITCPYGQPGDRLWVRETFQPLLAEGFDFRDACWETGKGYAPRYVATEGATEWVDPDDNISSASKPSIHMPRWASRLTLEITGVRVERLQAISIEDAKAEGVWGPDESIVGKVAEYFGTDEFSANPRRAFQMLWEQINGADSWAANPWVWVVEFKKLGNRDA